MYLPEIRTLHTYRAPCSFKPSLAEVLAQIPAAFLDQVVAFETLTRDVDMDQAVHVTTTKLYGTKPVAACPGLYIEQPNVVDGDNFYYPHGVSMTRAEVISRLEKQVGPGELVERDGKYYYRTGREAAMLLRALEVAGKKHAATLPAEDRLTKDGVRALPTDKTAPMLCRDLVVRSARAGGGISGQNVTFLGGLGSDLIQHPV